MSPASDSVVEPASVPALGASGLRSRISLYQGDITKLDVTIIVNAANNSLLGGGGVDGAIHSAAGPQLLEACRPLGGCKTGDAKLTPGFRLPARYVAHTVGPVYRVHSSKESAKLLAMCYARSIELANEVAKQETIGDEGVTIAFPSISCGVYGYPFEDAAAIALQTVKEKLSDPRYSAISRVLFVVFSQAHLKTYEKLAEKYFPK